MVEIGLFREPKAEKRKDGCTYWAGSGGGTTYKLPPGTSTSGCATWAIREAMVEPDEAGLVRQPAAAHRRGRIHDLGRHGVPEPVLRAQLAEGGR